MWKITSFLLEKCLFLWISPLFLISKKCASQVCREHANENKHFKSKNVKFILVQTKLNQASLHWRVTWNYANSPFKQKYSFQTKYLQQTLEMIKEISHTYSWGNKWLWTSLKKRFTSLQIFMNFMNRHQAYWGNGMHKPFPPSYPPIFKSKINVMEPTFYTHVWFLMHAKHAPLLIKPKNSTEIQGRYFSKY